MADESLTTRTMSAVEWRFAGAFVAAVVQFGIGVILARLLTPVDFGIIALALVVLGFTRLVGDVGMAGAIVQRAELTERHIRTAFTVSILFGLSVALIVVALAPLTAAVMREPALSRVLPALSLGLVVRSFSVVAGALLRRRLDFRRQFFIDTSSYLLGYACLALGLALRGFGVWSLVWGSLLQTLLSVIALLAAARHATRPLLAKRELHDLLHFGTGSTLSALANYVALNGDNFVVGRWMGTASLGLYSRAYNLMNLPHAYAAGVISAVLLPAFSQVQGERGRLRRGYLLITQVTALVAAPIMAGMMIAAPHLVSALYGAQWTPTAAPLQILCVAGYFRSLYHLGGIVAQSVGSVYGEFWRQVGYAVLVLAGAWVGSRYGLVGVASGVAVAIMYMFAATAQLALRITGVSWREYFGVQRLALATGVITAGLALGVRLSLEALEFFPAVIATAVAVGSAIPWSIGILWALGDPEFEPLRARLPAHGRRLVDRVSEYRRRRR